MILNNKNKLIINYFNKNSLSSTALHKTKNNLNKITFKQPKVNFYYLLNKNNLGLLKKVFSESIITYYNFFNLGDVQPISQNWSDLLWFFATSNKNRQKARASKKPTQLRTLSGL